MRKSLTGERLARTELDSDELIDGSFVVRSEEIVTRLKLHVTEVERWSSWIKLRDMTTERRFRTFS
jgi:hypothetical protein